MRTTGDPTGLERHDPARRPGHGRGDAGQPERRRAPTPTRAGSSPTACATRSASRSGPGPTRSGSATSAGARGRRSTASRTRPRRCATSAGRATRAPAAWTSYDTLNLNLCETLYDAGRRGARGAVLHLPPRARVVAGESVRHRLVVDLRHRLHAARRAASRRRTTARCSSPTTAATASGRCCAAPNGLPDPEQPSRPSWPRPRTRSSCSSAPAATSTTSTSRAAPIRRIRSVTTNRAPVARATATPVERHACR